MTEPHSPESSEEAKAAVSTPDPDAEVAPPEPEPEPWTAERVQEWNAYYDLYVVLAVVLLAFVASANKITHSTIWSQLRAGQIIASTGKPLVTDLFSYTEEGRRWVNIPWLFECGYALLHRGASGLLPADPADPAARARRADQLAAGVLVGLSALVRVATALVLLRIRRAGPGLWWSAVCVALALGAVYGPIGLMLGGIAGPAIVSPETWGQLFLALELLLLHRTIDLGRRGAAYGLVPLFLLWANVDESFLLGLILLAATVIGRVAARAGKGEVDPLPVGRGLVLLGACAAVCLINPSLHRAYAAALEPFVQLVAPANAPVSSDALSYFGKELRSGGAGLGAVWGNVVVYYGLAVLAGLASFAINARRFSLDRFLTFVVAALLWAVYIRYSWVFAVVAAAVLALNGQEWYLDRFGSQGRLGRGWAVWSTGGRFVTILLVFLCAAKALTGYGRSVGEAQFGFGYNADEFAFEAADFLRNARITGNVLNTTRLQGDSIVWRTYPVRKTFVDGRNHVFPPSLQRELHEARLALAEDDAARWKPFLDRHRISAVMIDPGSAPRTYRSLMQSPHWIPFYDDGGVVMFGRADATAGDVAFFEENRLDAEALAYKVMRPLPPSDRPPTPIGRMDEIFQNRFLQYPQPHTEAARRWLDPPVGAAESGAPTLPDPARCLLAIREARLALSRRPDDTRAYRLLSVAYRELMTIESGLLAGLTLTPKDREAFGRVIPRNDVLMNRFRQRITSLNFAIQTTPPSRNDAERAAIFPLSLELYQLYLSVNFADLARDRLQAMLARPPRELDSEFREQLSRELSQLDDRVRTIQDQMAEMVGSQQAGPLERAQLAISQGAPGLAIQELQEAHQINLNPAAVKPMLVDLYCDTGQPEKAFDILGESSGIDDPTLGTEPGTAALRQGRVYFLLGNYDYAATLWQRNAIQQLRFDRTYRAMGAGRSLLYGEAKGVISTFLNLSSKLTTQAVWENDLALCLLESGRPGEAAEAFTRALTIAPDLTTRPVIAYYLEKLGKPVPPPRKTEAKPDDAAKPAAEDKGADKPASTDKPAEAPAAGPK